MQWRAAIHIQVSSHPSKLKLDPSPRSSPPRVAPRRILIDPLLVIQWPSRSMTLPVTRHHQRTRLRSPGIHRVLMMPLTDHVAAVVAHMSEYVPRCAGLIDSACFKSTSSSGRLSRPWSKLTVQAMNPPAAPKSIETNNCYSSHFTPAALPYCDTQQFLTVSI